mgnify:CR=1 FL=1
MLLTCDANKRKRPPGVIGGEYLAGNQVRDAQSCREGDHGKFEVKTSDGWARIGIFHTSTHMLGTPTLLPVVNPNIQTISPMEMWEIGFEALITNSYIIWKTEKLKERALSEGVHKLLEFPGVVMTDSGVFQQYVYGDVEIGEVEVVDFQRDIGVDIATMMDVFGRPDMTFDELNDAVMETASRGPDALKAAGETLLNGPIQGGPNIELRTKSANLMSEMDFAVHPIGGIVPLMENQRYTDLIKIIVASKSKLTPERPVHLFGCGHPILFPISVALGVDLFDSAAYALFAKDGRLLSPTGTVKLADINEWPFTSPALWGHSPEEVRKMDKEERTEILARHNLQVTYSELARCREAIRNGTIWNLVEERSHSNAELRAATLWLYSNMPSDLILNSNPCRQGGVNFYSDIENNPRINHSKSWISWNSPPIDHLGNVIDPSNRVLVIIYGVRGPWRDTIGDFVGNIVRDWPNIAPIIYTPIGLIPFQLEDLNPFAHLIAPKNEFSCSLDEIMAHAEELENSNCIFWDASKEENSYEVFEEEAKNQMGGLGEKMPDGHGSIKDVKTHFQLFGICDKINIFTGLGSDVCHSIANRITFVMSRTKRVNNILLDGVHIFSQRLTDGGLSFTNEGAKWVHETMGEENCMPIVVVDSDAEPFIRAGRNVMHGFVVSCKGYPKNGMPCLITNDRGELVGHGIAQCGEREMRTFRKGIAVKVRGGINLEGD